MWLPIPDTKDEEMKKALSQWSRELSYFENVSLEQINNLKDVIQALEKEVSELKNGGDA